MESVVVAAIIANSNEELGQALTRLRGKVKRVQLDIMDGKFVVTRSLDFPFTLPAGFEYEVHLMVDDPLSWLKKLPKGIEYVIIHLEAMEDIEKTITWVKSSGFKIYIALSPDTPTKTLEGHLNKIDGVMIMTVQPGRYGAPFIPEALEKVKTIRQLNSQIAIEIDGGMNPENARAAAMMGANVIASGSYIMKSKNIEDAVEILKESIK